MRRSETTRPKKGYPMKQLTLAVFAGAGALYGCGSPHDVPEPVVDEVASAHDAITYGVLDGEAHPATVLLLMEANGEPAWRCTGTLLNATTVLTAGHCTEEPGAVSGIRAFTEADVDGGDNNYPYAGPNAVEAVAWASHPQYDTNAFFVHDVGVVKLAAPGVQLPANAYGKLPALNALDALKPSVKTKFTAVGYGMQRINAAMETGVRIRMRAEPHLVQINAPGFTGNFSLLLSNNASSGGTCFGDSGGPNFLGKGLVVAGVTSFGLNGSCGGTGGVFRMDRQDVLSFVNGWLN